ncbi:MAG: SRPBCC domain-containing protein [Anaerolineales bacterium]|nr:SRPBCC domain-containing protein [Anaerolineales bacterium]
MSDGEAPAVVTKSMVIARDVAAVFRIWTEQVHLWWPAGHSRSGDPYTKVIIEGRVGGRFYERTSNGDEYEWGRILIWEPPHRLVYTWYLGSSQELPTEVDVRFVPLNPQQTHLELEHRGVELIGDLWWQRVKIFNDSWDKILMTFQVHGGSHMV